MRIGIYDPYLDDLGGGEKYMLTMAECLSKRHDVTVFWNNKEDLNSVLQRFSIDLSKVNIAANIFGSKVGTIKRLLETKKYDAIILLTDGSIPFVLSKKLFIHAQQPLLGEARDLKIKAKLSRVTKFFSNSYFSKSFIDKFFNTDSVVVYPPITLHPKKIKKENIILHVGRFRVENIKISDYKKQSVMIEAFKKVVKKGLKGWKFVIAAGVKDSDSAEFESMVNSAKDAPIEFAVNKPNNDLWDIYSKAKIYWHASGFGENLEMHPEYAEHFGISTVEAMGAGAVPVVINAGGQKEIVQDGVNGLLWNTLSELEEKTLMLTSEEKILENMSREAKKRAYDFAGDRFCEEVTKLIENG